MKELSQKEKIVEGVALLICALMLIGFFFKVVFF